VSSSAQGAEGHHLSIHREQDTRNVRDFTDNPKAQAGLFPAIDDNDDENCQIIEEQ
jgi:hypothetical protein